MRRGSLEAVRNDPTAVPTPLEYLFQARLRAQAGSLACRETGFYGTPNRALMLSPLPSLPHLEITNGGLRSGVVRTGRGANSSPLADCERRAHLPWRAVTGKQGQSPS